MTEAMVGQRVKSKHTDSSIAGTIVGRTWFTPLPYSERSINAYIVHLDEPQPLADGSQIHFMLMNPEFSEIVIEYL